MASVTLQSELELAVGPSDSMLEKEPLDSNDQDPPLQLQQQVNYMTSFEDRKLVCVAVLVKNMLFFII